jgi:hypothetical protein
MSETQRTKLNPRWVVKIVLVMIVLFGFGLLALADAVYFYPRRGLEDASLKQLRYLEQMERIGSLDTASIPDPQARQATLAVRRAELEKAAEDRDKLQSLAGGSSEQSRQATIELRKLEPLLVDAAAMQWLDSLRVAGRLNKDMTAMPAPRDTLAQLRTKWKTSQAPKPLAAYDLPLQWVMLAGCVAITAYMLFFVLLPAKRTVYQWDPGEKRLTLPGGRSLVPADIAEIDKRKWDKFFVVILVKESAGGGQVKLDLLRHKHLEDWVLEMEREAFPELAAAAAANEAAIAGNVAPIAAENPAGGTPNNPV